MYPMYLLKSASQDRTRYGPGQVLYQQLSERAFPNRDTAPQGARATHNGKMSGTYGPSPIEILMNWSASHMSA